MLPLLVMSLEHEDVDVVRSAISALRWVNLGGPNVYYNDKLVGLLETIGRRVRILCVYFFFLRLPTHFHLVGTAHAC